MKQLPLIILLALVLVAVVMGCGGAHRYDSRLTAADSLMQPNPDSALALIEALPPDSLTDEGDRAYRDLLLTQARYKAYRDILASDNIAVNHALDYFRARSGECEKLTRAYIYKGAVMDELGHPDSAMFYYKHAEAIADEKDYANLGQINTRIASIYRRYFADHQICYDKYHQALKYYELTGNKRLQFDCLLYMGGCSGITQTDSPEKLLRQAAHLAMELNDSSGYFKSQELLCRQLYYRHESLNEAKQIALHCLIDLPNHVNDNLILDLADIYAHEGQPDSAEYYLSLVSGQSNAGSVGQNQARKYFVMSRISRLKGDTALSNHYDMLGHQLSDSVINNKQRFLIQQIEDDFNTTQYTSNILRLSKLKWAVIGISSIAILVIIILLIVYLRRVHKTKSIIKELADMLPNEHEDLISQLDEKNAAMERLFTNLVELIKMSVSENRKSSSTSDVAQQIKNTIINVADDDFWNELRTYLDNRYDGVITDFANNTGFTGKDLKFIELECCGFSYVEIAIIMNYSPRYVFNKRKIISQKLGIDMPLQDYLTLLLKSKGQS